MDPVQFAADGRAAVRISATPQTVTGKETGLLPVSVNKSAPGLELIPK